MNNLAQQYGIYHEKTPPYHPQANPTKRYNTTVKTMIMAYVEDDHRTWHRYSPEFQYALNTMKYSDNSESEPKTRHADQPGEKAQLSAS